MVWILALTFREFSCIWTLVVVSKTSWEFSCKYIPEDVVISVRPLLSRLSCSVVHFRYSGVCMFGLDWRGWCHYYWGKLIWYCLRRLYNKKLSHLSHLRRLLDVRGWWERISWSSFLQTETQTDLISIIQPLIVRQDNRIKKRLPRKIYFSPVNRQLKFSS